MGRWVEVARLDEIPTGQGRTVVADGIRIALFRTADRCFALDDVCPHEGGSLGEGVFHEGRVICPLHSWVFDVGSGQCPRGTHPGVRTFATRCTDGRIEIELSDTKGAAQE